METKIVSLDLIVSSRHQPRNEVGIVSDLVGAITRTYTFNSALSAVRRADSKLRLISGLRRYEAMKKAVELKPNIPAEVSVIIYEADELSADLEWVLAIDENRVRKPLSPVDEARALVELKLRVDCIELRNKLEGKKGWRDEEIPQSLEAWQVEYDRLAALASTKDRSLTSLISMQWPDLDEQMGISESDRRRMQRLSAAPAATQDALRASSLGVHQQVAISYAPTHRQLELIEAVRQFARPKDVPVLTPQAVTYALRDDRIQAIPTTTVLTEAVRLYRQEPKQTAKQLCQAIITNLTRVAEEFATGDNEDDYPQPNQATNNENRELSPTKGSISLNTRLARLQAEPPTISDAAP